MKTPTLHSAFLALFGLILSPLTAAYASSPPADSGHLCQPVDLKPWQLDRLRPAGKRLADLDVGAPRTVRMIYFLPKDRQAQPDIDATLDALMKDVQQSYAEQMENHGFGRRTFRFETDGDGKAVVHHVKGTFNDVHYHTDLWSKIWDEMAERFDLWRNIYLVTLDISDESQPCGLAAPWGPEGGLAIIPTHILHNEHPWACGNVAVIAHELGHTFGIAHDYFTNATRSPSSYHTDMMVTSFCAAEWLDAHRYFNIDQRYPAIDKKTTIRMLPPLAVPPNAIHLRFEVTDPDGLHQTQLHTQAGAGAAVGCQALSGKRATVEFVTHQVLEDMALRVVDVNGNVTYQEFPIDFTKILSPENVSIPDANLAAAVRETLGLPPADTITQLDMLRLRKLQASFRQITDLTGLEHAVNLIDLYLNGNQLRDISPIGGLNLLVVLELIDNRISNLSPLKQMNNLERLWLSENSVSDLLPLAGLTNLKTIWLAGNPVANTSPLHGLMRRNPYLEIDIDISLPHRLTKVSGDGQEGTAGVALAEPLVASVLDEDGSPLAGVVVTFSVSGGGGTLSSTTATTNANGRARSTLTLGPDLGTNTVTATVEGLGSVTFTAIGQATTDSDGEEADGGLADDESSGEDQPESEETPTTTVEFEGISTSHDSIRENDAQATTITLTVTLDKAAATDETITLAIVSPTQGKTAKRNEDFDATLPETLTIAKGQRTGTAQMTLTPKDNTTADGDKAFAVQATSSSGHAAFINIKIIDNDAAGEPQAWLTPDPSEVEFYADDTAWKTFTVHTNLDSVLVRANPSGSDPAIEIAGGQQVPTRNFCPAEGNDRPTRGRRDGWSLHVKACQAGQTKILLIDYDTGEVLQQYAVTVEASTSASASTVLNPSYPNPFNSETVLSYTLSTASDIRLEVFTLSGQRVAVLHEGFQAAGYHTVSMDADASALASGVYLYRLTTPAGRFVQKFTLLR